MWAGGRAYGYSRFKKSVPTENRGWGAASLRAGSALWAAVVITINNRNSSKQKARFIPLVVRAWSGCRCLSRLRGVCFAWANLSAYRNISPVAALPPCPYKIRSSLKNEFLYIYYNIYYNRATINTQRIHADYLRLLACVICPRGRGLIVGRVICV